MNEPATGRRWPSLREVWPALVAVIGTAGVIVAAIWTLAGPRATAAANTARLEEIAQRLDRMEMSIAQRLDRMEGRNEKRLDEMEGRLLAEIRGVRGLARRP